jgi:adenosylcobinamide-GDP ribazoletransferase
MRWTGPLESFALLTVLPVPDTARRSASGVLPWAPLVGLLLGGAATGVAVVGREAVSPFAGAVLALLVLAVLTRGLHLDGLADTADGLGPLRDRTRALEVMRQGDVGPFGVAAVVLVLLLQASCVASLLTADDGWAAIWAAVVVGRISMTRTGLPGTPVAAGSRLGRAVAGSVRWPVLAGWLAVGAAAIAALAVADPRLAAGLATGAVAGLVAGELVLRRAGHRIGGVSGDVMGGMAEVASTVALLVAAAFVEPGAAG